MINYQKHTLPNGLTVVVNRDRSSKLAAVNLLYKIGARNENPSRTGFAHLFEHLMFRGTKAVPDFDTPVQMACGENNAFTNNDYTDFYITLPKDNIETALWLESDRMTGLDISQENLETEKRVVIEEYKQRYLNQPYGDMSMLLRAWPTACIPTGGRRSDFRPITSPEPRSTKCAISTAVSTTRRTPFSPSRQISPKSGRSPCAKNGSTRSRTIRNLRHRFRRNRRKPNPDGRRSNATYQPR